MANNCLTGTNIPQVDNTEIACDLITKDICVRLSSNYPVLHSYEEDSLDALLRNVERDITMKNDLIAQLTQRIEALENLNTSNE